MYSNKFIDNTNRLESTFIRNRHHLGRRINTAGVLSPHGQLLNHIVRKISFLPHFRHVICYIEAGRALNHISRKISPLLYVWQDCILSICFDTTLSICYNKHPCTPRLISPLYCAVCTVWEHGASALCSVQWEESGVHVCPSVVLVTVCSFAPWWRRDFFGILGHPHHPRGLRLNMPVEP